MRAAAELAPRILHEASDTEARTFHSEQLHREFVEAGFYHLLRPRRYGGSEVPVPDFMRVMREIARADMSTAWCLALASGHNLQAASWFPESVQEELFDSSYFAATLTNTPSGTLKRVDGGFLHTGRHPYSSGIPYATHVMAVSLHEDRPDARSTFIVPRSDAHILNDWGFTLGLKGSGSHTVEFEDLFIPAERVLEGQAIPDMPLVAEGSPGVKLHGNPMYYGRAFAFFGLELANVLVGAVRGALDEYEALMPGKRIPRPPFLTRAEDVTYLGWYARTQVELMTAEAAVDRAADLMMEHSRRAVSEGPDAYTLGDDFLLSTLAHEGLGIAWRSLQRIVGTAGTSSVVNGGRIERVLRDATMAWGHFNTIATAWSAVGYAREHFSRPGSEA